MTNQFDAWLNGVPVIGFPGSDFGEWLNGVPSVDQGGVTVLPYSGHGTCSSGATGTGFLPPPGILASSGYPVAQSSALLLGAMALAGNGFGTVIGTGSSVPIPPPSAGTWYLRRVSPTQPNVRELVAGMPGWNKKVSSRPPRQRSVIF